MRVLVVGAGIAGLTFARSITAKGIFVDVVERVPQLGVVGAGIILQPNGMAMMGQLGLADKIMRSGSTITHMRHSRGTEPLLLPLAKVWQGIEYPTVGIRRSDLQAILLDGLTANRPNIRIRYGTSVCNIRSVEDGPVASFDDGIGNKTYDLVIGADGVNSRLRQQLFQNSHAEPAGLQWWRMIAKCPADVGPREWISTDCSDGSFGIYPIGGNFVHSHVMFRGTNSPCKRGEETAYLGHEVASWDPLIAAVIQNRCTMPHIGAPMMVRPATWGLGLCVLIGDAAHAISPTLSQGGSLAMEDGFALASLLQHSDDIGTLLNRFASSRNSSVNWALKMATAQVNGLRRPMASANVLDNSALAIRYMQRMYAPLIAHSAQLQQMSL
jgi:FAD-dependent urate hydroxylase